MRSSHCRCREAAKSKAQCQDRFAATDPFCPSSGASSVFSVSLEHCRPVGRRKARLGSQNTKAQLILLGCMRLHTLAVLSTFLLAACSSGPPDSYGLTCQIGARSVGEMKANDDAQSTETASATVCLIPGCAGELGTR
ncbi:hypothetical protein GQ53DRAFT_331559 [Thozetella sp. PMI_491]|nr:hypothetical protein GQ53DRAFT_331559 [Thozetella sp. PMI_491]